MCRAANPRQAPLYGRTHDHILRRAYTSMWCVRTYFLSFLPLFPVLFLFLLRSVAWPYMFGKKADDLQQANAADDEYMISDNDLLVGKFISIPKSYSSFVPGSLVAGVVRGMLDAAGFPAR